MFEAWGMVNRTRNSISRRGTSFPNHGLMILIAVLLLALAVGIPAWKSHGVQGCLSTLAALIGGLATVVGAGVGVAWIAENVNREGHGSADKAWHALGHGLRFLLGALAGLVIAAPLVAPRHLGPLLGNLHVGACALGMGAVSVWAYLRFGGKHYLRLIKGFAGALLVSWVLGMLSLLLPWPWAMDVAVLLPLAVFVGRVRFAIRRMENPPPTSEPPDSPSPWPPGAQKETPTGPRPNVHTSPPPVHH